MLKNKYVAILSIFIIASLITIISCGRKGTLNPNSAPYIEISEYSGIAKPDTTLTDEKLLSILQTNPDSLINTDIYDSLFYQQIFWNAWDEDGTIKGYAYRIGTWDTLDADGDNYKWNENSLTHWDYDNAYGIVVDDEGWVYHYAPGADQTIPLSDPEAKKTIWTSPNVVSAKVYFPSTDTTDFRNNFGKFEVKCRDNRGEVSNTAAKYFATYSEIPKTYISTSQGNIDSCRVGTAILFKFIVNDKDPFGLGKEAAYYKYRLVHVARVGAREDTLGKGFDNYRFSIGTEILPGSDTTWYSTQGFEKPDEVLLRAEYPDDDPYADRKPHLLSNDVNELTQMQVKAVDKAGIEDPNYAKMSFFVRGYFKPETMPFMVSTAELRVLCDIYVLGKYHYLTYLPGTKEVPKKKVGDEYHYATQFYYDQYRNLSAMWSDDIEIYLKWQYKGEYEKDPERGVQFTEYTYHYDENLPTTNKYCQYYCDVEYMDIQLDSTTTGLPPISTEIVSDESGDWIRVPIYKDQECKLFDISAGQHIFRVRTVDFQGHVDPTPESLEFELFEMPEEKNGILLVDDTPLSTPFSIDDSVNAFYTGLLADCSETTIDTFTLNVTTTPASSPLYEISKLNFEIEHLNKPYFALSDILKYKLIIWHYNIPTKVFGDAMCHFKTHYDLLSVYVNTGGNIVFTGSAGIHDPTDAKNRFLENYAGFSENSSTMNKTIFWTNPDTTNSIFVGAAGAGDFSDIDSLYINLHIYKWPNSNYFPEYFPATTYIGGAIGGITFFDLGSGTPIFNCIPKSSVQNPQNYYGCVGSKYTKEPGVTGTTYILGFPLYYIQLDDAKRFINKVFDEVGISYQQ